jgi:REP element-mobilizing transposase RayT
MPYQELLKGRVSIPGQVYLITTVTHGRQSLFSNLPAGRLVVSGIRKFDAEQVTQTLAFVVMPDHFHWLLQLGRQQSLSDLLQLFKGRTARAINLLEHSQGPVWQHGFHEHAVRDDESLVDIARYIIMNPVRAGLVERPGDYSLWDAIWI